MLKGEKFDASALMLAIKYCYACYQIYVCLLSNVSLIAIKDVFNYKNAIFLEYHNFQYSVSS